MRILSLSAAIGAVVLSAIQLVQADISKIVRVDQPSQQLIDAEGRSRWFHGTNIVKKAFPWHVDVENFVPNWSLVDKDIELLKTMNINSVRLGMFLFFVLTLLVCIVFVEQ
jgi:endoglycosylceramidase